MRLRGIRTLKEANRFLSYYLPVHNRRFGFTVIEEGDLHRAIPTGIDLDKVLCIKTERGLGNDFTVAHDKKLYQVLEHVNTKKVVVEEKINGSMLITYKGRGLKYKEIDKRPVREEPKKPYKFKEKKVYRPPMDHPWKRPMYERNLALRQARSQRENERALLTPTT